MKRFFTLRNQRFGENPHRLIMVLISMFVLCATVPLSAANTLFRNGKSKYRIVVATSASTSEQTAAEELQKYIREISGVELPIVNDLNTKGAKIFVGYNSRVGEILGQKNIDELDETFTYESRGKDLFIYGGSLRGTLYGVYLK